MKTKFNGILTLFLALIVQISFAQERTISGGVSDDSGPLPGVSVLKKGTKTGTETNFDGKYSIKAKTGDVLVFSFVGMKTVEKTVGNSSKINVKMSEDSSVLEEVIITALGLEKKKDEDLSSSTTIDTSVLKRSGESGVIQGLAGKTSGVTITRSSGDPGAGANIQIRGQNTILGSNQPLIVIDGVVVSNQNLESDAAEATAGVTQQSRLNDIPSEDIENITVLKGAAAAAVYGTGAANGAIIITTKKGRANGKKWSVNVKSAVSIDQINIEWDKQSKYGQGSQNKFLGALAAAGNPINGAGYQRNFNNGISWGDKIADRSGGADGFVIGTERFVSESGRVFYPYSANSITNTINKNSRQTFNESNRNSVFGDGISFDNSVSLSHAGEDSRTFMSLANWDQEGIIKNGSNYNRTTFRVNHEVNFSEKLTGKVSATHINIDSDRIQKGSNVNGLYLGYLRTPADFDQTDYRGTYFNASGAPTLNSHRAFRDYLGSGAPTYNNPLWTTNEQVNTSDVNRFLITPELNYKFSDAVRLTARYGLDYFTDDRITFFPFNSGASFAQGSYRSEKASNKIQSINAFLNGNHTITDNFDFSWIAGFQAEKTDFERITGTVTNFTNSGVTLDDARDFNNSTADNQTPLDTYLFTKKNGAYTVLNATLYDQLFLEATARVEKISSIPNKTIFYPSASVGWQFSKVTGINDSFSFGKLRFTYGEVGVAPDPYQTLNTFLGGTVASSWGDQLVGSQFGSTFTRAALKGNPDIKEERVKEFEIGTDLRFFNNRLNFGFTYYSRKTEDALLPVGLAASTGFLNTVKNAAEIENKGLEIDLTGTIISNEDLTWKMSLNFSKNSNLVTKLEGSDRVFLDGFTGTSSSVVLDNPFGALFGGKWLRDANNEIILDAAGFPDEDPAAGVIGDPNPDWRGGISTSVTWKNLTLSGSLETSQGNDVWNGTRGVMYFFGVHPDTANEVTVSAADAATITNFNGTAINALPNINPNSDGSYTVRGNLQDFGAGTRLLDQSWYTSRGGGFGNVAEQFVEDGSFVKLREVSLSYSLPKKFLQNTFINSLQFSFTGRNLYTWTEVEGFDPESNLTGASRGRGLEYFTNPGTRSFIMSLKLGF